MKHKKSGHGEHSDEQLQLRRRAEAQLREKSIGGAPTKTETDALRQVHELQVYQIELEMQNLELQSIRSELEASLARYTMLYDFAPIGYFTLDAVGVVLEVNLSAASLLGAARSNLTGRHLSDFVAIESRSAFTAFLAAIFAGQAVDEAREIVLVNESQQRIFVHLEGAVDESQRTCRVIALNVNARVQAEQAMREAERRAKELVTQNRMLTRRMFTLEESERRDLARELHDELGQWLTAIRAEAEAILGRMPDEPGSPVRDSAHAICDSAAEVQRMIRRILHRLRPSLLDTLGLAESLKDLTAQWRRHQPQVDCQLTIDGDFRGISDALAITVYRVIQEALNNVARHAQASRVNITLRRVRPVQGAGELLLLTVEDNGKGIAPERSRVGLGLMGMRERVIAAGGELTLGSPPTMGVSLTVELPLESLHTPGENHGTNLRAT